MAVHRFAFSVVLMVCTACSSQPVTYSLLNPPSEHIWPTPPDTPRYQLQGYLFGEINLIKDESADRGFWKTLGYILTGLIFGESTPQQFQRPVSGHWDGVTGHLLVTDSATHSVFVFHPEQGTLRQWMGPDELSNFKTPLDVTVGPQSGYWVSDADLGLVALMTLDGGSIMHIRHPSLLRPTGLAWDGLRDRLYVADAAAHDIKIFSGKGELLSVFGGKGEVDGRLNSPTFLALMENELYVSDTLNARVQVFDTKGQWLRSIGSRGLRVGQLVRPKGVSLDENNRLYIVESYYDYLLVYDNQGQFLLPVGGEGQEPGRFYLPSGVWHDGLTVYVADTFNARVAVLKYIGED